MNIDFYFQMKNGKIDTELAMEKIKLMFNPSEEELAKIKQVHAECDGVGSGADRCDDAFQQMRCAINTAKKLGLPLPDFD